jgi:hypothetical protein
MTNANIDKQRAGERRQTRSRSSTRTASRRSRCRRRYFTSCRAPARLKPANIFAGARNGQRRQAGRRRACVSKMASSLRSSSPDRGLVALGMTQCRRRRACAGTISAGREETGSWWTEKPRCLGRHDRRFVFSAAGGLVDITAGRFLGVTSVKHADGKLIAYEVRRFPKPLSPATAVRRARTTGPMTNATSGADGAVGQRPRAHHDLTTAARRRSTVPPEASCRRWCGRSASSCPARRCEPDTDASGVASGSKSGPSNRLAA